MVVTWNRELKWHQEGRACIIQSECMVQSLRFWEIFVIRSLFVIQSAQKITFLTRSAKIQLVHPFKNFITIIKSIYSYYYLQYPGNGIPKFQPVVVSSFGVIVFVRKKLICTVTIWDCDCTTDPSSVRLKVATVWDLYSNCMRNKLQARRNFHLLGFDLKHSPWNGTPTDLVTCTYGQDLVYNGRDMLHSWYGYKGSLVEKSYSNLFFAFTTCNTLIVGITGTKHKYRV